MWIKIMIQLFGEAREWEVVMGIQNIWKSSTSFSTTKGRQYVIFSTDMSGNSLNTYFDRWGQIPKQQWKKWEMVGFELWRLLFFLFFFFFFGVSHWYLVTVFHYTCLGAIKISFSRCQWIMPVFLATQDAEIRTAFRSQSGQIVRKTLS
jgi:hypothetical protein